MKRSTTSKFSIKTNASANWLAHAIQLVVALKMAPLLVANLGYSRYGVWSVAESVLAYLMLFDLGVGAAVLRNVARFDELRDTKSLNRNFSTSVCIFMAGGAVAWLIAMGIAFGFERPLNVSPEYVPDIRWLLALSATSLAIGLPMGVFSAVLSGLGRYPILSLISTAGLLVRSGLFLVVLKLHYGLPGLAIVMFATSLAENLAMALAAWHYLPVLRFSFSLCDMHTFRQIRGYSFQAFVAMMAGRLSFQTDAIVIKGFMRSEVNVTYFVLGAKLVEYAKGSVRALTQVLTTAISALDVRDDHAAIRRVLIDGTRYVLWIVLPIQAGFFLLGKQFLTIWLGAELSEHSYPILVILAVPFSLAMSQSISGRILYAMGNLRLFAAMTISEGLTNLVMSIALVSPQGIRGVAIGTAIPNLLFNLALAVYICRTTGVSVFEYLRRAFLKPLLIVAVPSAIWLATNKYWPEPTLWIQFVAIGALGMTAYLPLAALVEFGPRRTFQFVKRRWAAAVDDT